LSAPERGHSFCSVMLIIVTTATVAGWLALWAALAARTSATWARAVARQPPRLAGSESPAVVSLLAGHLPSLGYPATLLDLAARGWFRLESPARGPVMCVLAHNPPASELTAYERRVYTHVVTRAGDRADIPAAALSDGFTGPAAGGGAMKSAIRSREACCKSAAWWYRYWRSSCSP